MYNNLKYNAIYNTYTILYYVSHKTREFSAGFSKKTKTLDIVHLQWVIIYVLRTPNDRN